MARDLELRVSSKTNDAGLRAAAREVDRLGRAADDLGDQFRQAERAAASLDRQLAETAATTALLAKELSKTGDADIKKQLDAQRTAAADLRRLRQDIIGSTEVDAKKATSAWERASADLKRALNKTSEDAGINSSKTFASAFQGGILNAFKSPQGIAAITAAVTLLAVPIGAAIGGTVLAGAGAAGAGLAAFAAAKSDQSGRIAAAGNDLIAAVNKQFSAGGRGAIEPLLAGIRELKLGLADVHLDQIIASASKYIQPLAAGAARFATYIAQAGQKLLDAGGPAVKVLADELPNIGRAVKEAADAIAGGSEGGARALQDFLRAIESFIITTGKIIGVLERAYGAIRSFGDGFESFLQKAHDANILLAGLVYPAQQLLDIFDTGQQTASGYAHKLGEVSKESAIMANQAKQAAEDIQAIGSAFTNLGQSAEGALTNQILDRMFALDEATLNFQESLNGLNDAAKENGRSLQGNSEKVLKNKEALLSAAEANANLYAQNLLAGDSAEVAGQKYEANAAILRKQAIDAGYNAGEVDKLIGKYGQVPEKVQTILATIGLTDALNKLGQVLIDFRNLDNKSFQTKYYIDTYFRDHGGSYGGGEAAKHQLPPGHRAGGGPVMAGRPYFVGERGIETFIPSQSGSILNAVQTAAMMGRSSVTSRWAGGGTAAQAITVTLNLAGSNTALGAALATVIRSGDAQLVAVDGNNNRLPVKVA